MNRRRVVVTGAGVISAIGNDISSFSENLFKGKNGIEPLFGFDTSRIRIATGAQVKDYTPSDHFDRKQLALLDRFAQLGLIAARQAVKQSEISWDKTLQKKTAIVVGSSIGGQHTQDAIFKEIYQEGAEQANLFTIPLIMPNAASSHISMEFGITGPNYTVSTACSSSNHAIGNAFWLIRNGVCDAAVTGGCESPFSLGFLKAWEALRVVAPETCRPFSKNRNGMILGEGGAMLVLETLEKAEKRGAKILGEICGFGMTADASHVTRPSQTGAEEAMQEAIEDARIQPEMIGYINAHGTGTLANDPMEIRAIKKVFGDATTSLSISSTKSMHGHILGGTSAVESIATLLALQNQIIPPTANFTEPDPECDLDVVPNQSKVKEFEYALSNSFAFGGLNAGLVFRKWMG